jgi:hypothetical protein
MAPGRLVAAGLNRVPASAVYRFDLGMTGADIIASVERQLAGGERQGVRQLTRH